MTEMLSKTWRSSRYWICCQEKTHRHLQRVVYIRHSDHVHMFSLTHSSGQFLLVLYIEVEQYKP